jgi:hypothetical protein
MTKINNFNIKVLIGSEYKVLNIQCEREKIIDKIKEVLNATPSVIIIRSDDNSKQNN